MAVFRDVTWLLTDVPEDLTAFIIRIINIPCHRDVGDSVSETSVGIYQITGWYIPEDIRLSTRDDVSEMKWQESVDCYISRSSAFCALCQMLLGLWNRGG
jgi:hypothetical protein